MASYRTVGTRRAPRAGTVVGLALVPSARNRHSAISTTFSGNGSGALAVTNADRVLGGPNYRLRPDAAERLAHGARPTDNNAQYVAYDSLAPTARVTNVPTSPMTDPERGRKLSGKYRKASPGNPTGGLGGRQAGPSMIDASLTAHVHPMTKDLPNA